MNNYKEKYIKYKLKYLKIKGGKNYDSPGFLMLPHKICITISNLCGSLEITDFDENTNFNQDDFIFVFDNIDTYNFFTKLPNFIKNVKKLKLDFNDAINDLIYPTNLIVLIFGDTFNQPIGMIETETDKKATGFLLETDKKATGFLPKTLNTLVFGKKFNQQLGIRTNFTRFGLKIINIKNFSFLPALLEVLIIYSDTFNNPLLDSNSSNLQQTSYLPNTLKYIKITSSKLTYPIIKRISILTYEPISITTFSKLVRLEINKPDYYKDMTTDEYKTLLKTLIF